MKTCAIDDHDVTDAGQMTNTQFRQAMDEINATLDQMARLLGIARRLIADYRKDKPVPRAVALATRQLIEMARR